MKKSTKKVLTILAVVAVIAVAIPVGMYIAGNYYFTDARIYEENWGVNLPSNIKEEYSKKTETSFHGDGLRYTIFKYEDSSSEFISSLSSDKDMDIENEFSAILASLSVEKNNYPDFTHDYLSQCKDSYGNELYIIYDAIENKLYLVQKTV